MNACRYRMIPKVVFLSLFVFFSVVLNSCTLERQGPENADGKTKNERLVARDIGFGFSNIRWCGNDRLLLYGNTRGLKLLDLTTGKWTTLSKDGSDYPVECTRDGKWVIYIDRKSWRIDKGRVAPPDEELEGEIEWQGFVEDLYRYEVLTGKRQVFAVVRDRPNPLNIVSPDGAKAFLGGRHDTPFEMPEPKWEMRWLENEWAHLDPIWLADSSGIVTMVSDEKVSLGVEIFGENGWSRVFIPGRDLDIKGQLGDAVAIKNKTISLLTGESYSEVKMGREMGRDRYYFYTCDIEHSGLNCKEILQFDLRHTDIRYAALPSGDIIYKDVDYRCIRRFSQSRAKTECIVDGSDLGRFYGLSPDGSRIAYNRNIIEENKSTRYDLYMMEINR